MNKISCIQCLEMPSTMLYVAICCRFDFGEIVSIVESKFKCEINRTSSFLKNISIL